MPKGTKAVFARGGYMLRQPIKHKTTILHFFFMLLVISSRFQANAQSVDIATTEFDLPNFVDSFQISALGNERISVYKNSDSQYFYQPLLLPDWTTFKANLDMLCPDAGADTLVTTQLTVETMRQGYLDELKTQLQAQGEGATNINPYPHAFFQVFVDTGEKTLLVSDEFLPAGDAGVSLQIGTALP